MKLNSKQKLYASVLGLCAAAFLVDKTFLGPSSASAESMPDSPVTPPTASLVDGADSVGVEELGTVDSARANIADRLETVAERRQIERDSIPDAFQPGVTWMPVREVVARPVVDAGGTGDRFREAHQLNAVMAGSTSFALVDGRTLLVGQTLDGFTLISVSETSALFESEKGQVELSLPVEDR